MTFWLFAFSCWYLDEKVNNTIQEVCQQQPDSSVQLQQ